MKFVKAFSLFFFLLSSTILGLALLANSTIINPRRACAARVTVLVVVMTTLTIFCGVQVNVRDASYTSQVEAVLAGRDFYSFVALTKEDKSTLLKEVHSFACVQCTYNYLRVFLVRT